MPKDIKISEPLHVERKFHVDKDFQWLSQDPTQIFDLQRKLGEGAFGAVYEAKFKQTGFVLAVKVIQVGKNHASITKEVDLLKRVSHKNTVRYYGSCPNGDDVWIMMDYCGGGSIHDLLEYTVIPEKAIQWVCMGALEGLAYLHTLNIIHRDIKSANILLTEVGDVKIADFGVSDQVTQTICARNTLVGTPFWMSPEVVQGRDYNISADIWSFGITAIEMAEGAPPIAKQFPNPMRAMFKIPFLPPPTLNESEKFSQKFNDFLSACLVKEPSKRASAQMLLQHDFVKEAPKSAKVLLDLMAEVKQEKHEDKTTSNARTVMPKDAKKQSDAKAETFIYNGPTWVSPENGKKEQPVATPDIAAASVVIHETIAAEKPAVSGTVIEHDVPDEHVKKPRFFDKFKRAPSSNMVKKQASSAAELVVKSAQVQESEVIGELKRAPSSSAMVIPTPPLPELKDDGLKHRKRALPPTPEEKPAEEATLFKRDAIRFGDKLSLLYLVLVVFLLLTTVYYRNQAYSCYENRQKDLEMLRKTGGVKRRHSAFCEYLCE